MTKNKLLEISRQKVLPEWIDHNGHMNVAYYVMVFDTSLDELLDQAGFTREYRETHKCGVYVLETHVSYLQEVKEGDPLIISVQVVDCDEKRIHLFLEMHHAEQGFLAATSEQMILHIDATGPKAAPMPAKMYTHLKNLQNEQAHLPKPPQVGAQIGIRKKAVSA